MSKYIHFMTFLFLFILINNNVIKSDDELINCQLIGKEKGRKQTEPTTLGGMCLNNIVQNLSTTIKTISEDEFGLNEFKNIIDQFDFINLPDDSNSLFKSLIYDMNVKLKYFIDILEENLNIIEPIIQKNLYNQTIVNEKSQESKTENKKPFDFCSKIQDAFESNSLNNRWKQIRVLPLNHPGKICGPAGLIRNIGSVFLSQCNKQRNVIVLMEHGTFMSEDNIIYSRAIAKNIVDMLSSSDNITVIGLLNQNFIYCKESLVKATDFNKLQLIKYIDSIIRTEGNEPTAIDFQLLSENLQDDVIVVHITNTLKDISNIESIIKNISLNNVNVHLRTALIVDFKPLINVKETFIDENVAMLPTNNPLGYDIARLFASIDCPIMNKKNLYLSDIFLEPFDKILMVSIARATDNSIISLDVKLSDIIDKITYFNGGNNNYIVLFDKRGFVWMHKYFPRIETLSEQSIKVSLSDIENINSNIVDKMVKLSDGELKTVNKLNKTIKLKWKHLKYLDLIVCKVTQLSSHTAVKSIIDNPLPLPKNILHHRLDLVSQNIADIAKLCLDKKNVISLANGIVYFTPWCLNSGRDHPTSLINLQNYMTYIKDTTGFVADPGLNQFVRKDASMMAKMLDYFKQRHESSLLKMFILKRYITAIESGVIEIYPGIALNSNLDPKRRAWYGKALEYPDRLILTAPYLDAAGAGYILTLSQAVQRDNQDNVNKNNIAVLSIDITIGYIARLLRDMLPFCKDSDIKCFLMDDKGYLVYHPSFLEPGSRLEYEHLTHKELLVANDILNHEYFVKKKVCINYLDGTLQRSYQFNISFEHVLHNLVPGEHCVKYQMAAVPNTNLFFGVVNETCASPAFCPCSTMNRICLNCQRMEQTECECPCECSLYTSSCNNIDDEDDADDDDVDVETYEPCLPPYEQGIVLNNRWDRVSIPQNLNLKQCPSSNCDNYQTESECLGIVGCQWCSIDIDGETNLAGPYCSDIYSCFRGIYKSNSPYIDGPYNTQSMDDDNDDSPSVGPIAGGILAIVLVFGVSLFCYRLHTVQSGPEHQCLHQGSPNLLRMAHLDVGLTGDADPSELDRSKNHLDTLLNEIIPPISPYRVSSNYRKPPGGDSDHGYSTMTPHDDNDQQSFADPLIPSDNDNDFFHQIRSPSPTTHLETPHRVLAPVTVHRNMDTNFF